MEPKVRDITDITQMRPACDLDAEEKAVWKRALVQFSPRPGMEELLTSYSVLSARLSRTKDQLDQEPAIITGATGGQVINPLVKLFMDTSRELRLLYGKLVQHIETAGARDQKTRKARELLD